MYRLNNVLLIRFYSGYQGWWNDATVDGPDSCYVRKKVTWLTYFDHQMKTSHNVVEKFYSNTLQCFLHDSSSQSVNYLTAVNPDDHVEIQFIVN